MSARRSARARVATPFTVEALWQLKRIGNPTVSPDGRVACASVTSFAMEKNEGTTELWLFPTGFPGKEATPAAKPRRLTAGIRTASRAGRRTASGSPLPPSARTTPSRKSI